MDLSGNTHELLSQIGLRRSVQHLGLGLGTIGGPAERASHRAKTQHDGYEPKDEKDLVALATFRRAELEIVHSEAAVLRRESRDELLVRSGGTTSLLDLNLSVGVVQLIDHIAIGVAKLEISESFDAVVVNSNTGGLREARRLGTWVETERHRHAET